MSDERIRAALAAVSVEPEAYERQERAYARRAVALTGTVIDASEYLCDHCGLRGATHYASPDVPLCDDCAASITVEAAE